MPGINSDRILSLGDALPGLREGSGSAGNATMGVQQIVSVPVGAPLLVDSVTYKHGVFIAPVDGCYIKDLKLSAAVAIAGGTHTFAVDNYDASGNSARNVLSTTNIDPAGVTTKEGLALTLTSTNTDLYMDEGDVLNVTLVCGTMTTDGEGYVLTAVVIVPEVR